MRIGSKVAPKTTCGLMLADCPINGKYHQTRKEVCVFVGTGTIINRKKCIIDYDVWEILEGLEPSGLGKVEYINYLIRCGTGTGWAGAGAIIQIK